MNDFTEFQKSLLDAAADYESCMSLSVSEEGKAVELLLDTNLSTYSEWLPGEGADIGLIRELGTDRVVGVRLPLLNRKLSVHHEGPLKINEGFRLPSKQ